ncbi:ABC transporter ATP-binding protein [uncultured Thioclava sp.]|uniref:ABC transporter ATP-binding protein n=1 Tax=uncultured Thioclava sp. TaxID=473858 RepID=UPI0025FDFB4C|nr:ABC transporter ATP-binding protein [uncultured Thioclava sp.]
MLEFNKRQIDRQPEARADGAIPSAIAVSALHLNYGAAQILRGIDLTIQPGKALALLGPSGSGKTTLLRVLAGLETPSAGEVSVHGKCVAAPAQNLFVPPERRGLGMVFQDYALWPHMSVARNVAFPLEMQGVGRSEREQRTKDALDQVGLGAMGTRRPSALSGGQQQRVGIARAIASGAKTILFDEPLSNLDRELRESMVDEIASLVADLGLTALYVTHDHAEAFSLADEVAILRAGQIAQRGTPETLVNEPATPWIAEFLRLGAVLPVGANGVLFAYITPPEGATSVLLPRRALSICAPAEAVFSAHVLRCLYRGEDYQVTVALPGNVELQIASPRRVARGAQLNLHIAPEALRWFHTPNAN